MHDTADPAADDRAQAAPIRLAVSSNAPDEASELGGRVWYPHQLDIGRSAAGFQWRVNAINLR
jgi:hypothetical protein